MVTLVLIGFLGGLITGVSPCILPVLPIVFLSGTQSSEAPQQTVETGRRRRWVRLLRPYGVVAGLVVSFSLVTLLGTTLLHVLHLPQDTVRWVGLVALCLIGLGLIFPKVEKLVERPFALLPQRPVGRTKNGFALGLALGVLYVPCAGPVLAAIVVAGATGHIGSSTIGLTVSFAVGAAVPLLVFALAGNRVAERVGAFRRHQRGTRIAAGVVLIALACALVFDVPQLVQRTLPDYTNALQNSLGKDANVLDQLSGNDFGRCVDSSDLPDCGTAPNFTDIDSWLNTPGNAPIDMTALRGKVVLVDFWAYSCINCQRAIPHVAAWYDQYHKDGLEVVGVHTPEYAFEHVPGNIADAAGRMTMHYPIAIDNNYGTWNAYHNRYWPAEYLIDANGHIRHAHFGEGDYDATENQIRTLLSDTAPNHVLGPRTAVADQTPTTSTTQETYLGSERADNYGGDEKYQAGSHDFHFPQHQPSDSFAYRGRWTLDPQRVTAESDDAAISLNYHARNAYLVVGGTGTLTITSDTGTTTQQISGPPTSHLVASSPDNNPRHLEISLSKGLQAYSFTFG